MSDLILAVCLGGVLVVVGVGAGFGGAYLLLRIGTTNLLLTSTKLVDRPLPPDSKPTVYGTTPPQPEPRRTASAWQSVEDLPSAYPPPAAVYDQSAPLTPDDPYPGITAADLKRADAMAEVSRMVEARERYGDNYGMMTDGKV